MMKNVRDFTGLLDMPEKVLLQQDFNIGMRAGFRHQGKAPCFADRARRALNQGFLLSKAGASPVCPALLIPLQGSRNSPKSAEWELP